MNAPSSSPPPRSGRSSASPAIASGAVRKLLLALPDLGIDAEAIREEAGIAREQLENIDGRVPIAQLHAAWIATARKIRDADLALRVAQRYAPGDYGLVGFVAMNSVTLG